MLGFLRPTNLNGNHLFFGSSSSLLNLIYLLLSRIQQAPFGDDILTSKFGLDKLIEFALIFYEIQMSSRYLQLESQFLIELLLMLLFFYCLLKYLFFKFELIWKHLIQ